MKLAVRDKIEDTIDDDDDDEFESDDNNGPDNSAPSDPDRLTKD